MDSFYTELDFGALGVLDVEVEYEWDGHAELTGAWVEIGIKLNEILTLIKAHHFDKLVNEAEDHHRCKLEYQRDLQGDR